MNTMNKLGLLLLVVRTITGSPYSQSEVSDYEDYDNSDMKSDNHNEIRISTTPKFQTNPQILLVNEGDTVRLPCYVDKLEGFVMLWKRNVDIITVGSQIIDKNVRLEETGNGNTLVIGPASPSDEAEYTCQISAYKPTEITHKLKIRVKPVLQLTPSDHLIVNEGDAAQLSCSLLAGSPTPQLSWARRSKAMPGGEETVAGGDLRFPAVTRHHAGHYLCSADNGFGPEPVTAQIKLTVHHTPAVEPQSVSEVYSGLELKEKLECVVHSSPRAVVVWTRDGAVLDNSMDNILISQEANRHLISIDMKTQEMFGTYKCEASNELGSAHSSVLVTGLATPPVFTSAAVSLYSDTYTLAWTSDSKSEITSFRVLYREARGEGWTEVEVVPRQASIDQQGGGRWEGSALLSHLSPAAQYEAKVLPRNFFGYTQPAQPSLVFNFATKGAVPYHQPSTSASTSTTSTTYGLLTLVLSLLLVR